MESKAVFFFLRMGRAVLVFSIWSEGSGETPQSRNSSSGSSVEVEFRDGWEIGWIGERMYRNRETVMNSEVEIDMTGSFWIMIL